MKGFIEIDTGYSEMGNYTNKGNRQSLYIRVSTIDSYSMNSTGKLVCIHTNKDIVTQFTTIEAFETAYFDCMQ